MRCKLKRRVMEIEDPSDVLKEKCDQLAEAIKKAKGVCVYTGAGISTAASIPDYRGPNGVWTLLRKGQQLKPQELTDSEPTKTHMSVISLYKHGKVLKKYACLWCMNKKPSKRPKLFIVNLQWTPKDDLATLKINGKCDDVMEKVMKKLGWKIPEYTREKDPLFRMAVPLQPHEYNTVSSKQLQAFFPPF
ncbi:SIRT7 [Acanthosepion pharaonis]|uniref:SIRT7 n=1 Tax=Acanthosepion pharaonis TaxID=158019 RepID=A0A812DLF7_ACAPH|nr:SIRT7 [Sepia pharaonis]